MNNSIPQLREKQVEQLAFYIANKKCLDLSDPGTGKTPPCCVMSYFVWAKEQGRTVWSMPKSLLKKNKKELERFTPFEDADVAIMHTDRANLTKNWTGATIESTRRVATWKLEDGTYTHELEGKRKLFYEDAQGSPLVLRTGKPMPSTYDPAEWVKVAPLRGPDGLPRKQWVDVPETFKDLIVEAAKTAKVFICTFAFLSSHWKRLMEAAPDLDLFLVDELHMGYGGPNSKQTESFYWVNKHCSRFIGMTGTLINGRLDSAFPAVHVIEPRYYGSLRGFYFEHAAVVDDYDRVVVWKNEAKLGEILKRHSIRRTFEEVYGEEDVVFQTEYVDMDDKTREAYDKFHDQAMLELEDESVIDGTSPGVALVRARQIMSHPHTMLSGLPEHTAKEERVMVHLSQGRTTLVFASLQPEQDRLLAVAKSMGLRAALINGNTPTPERVRIDEAAQRGELDVIVASGPTTAVGYNWEMFDLVLFVSIDFMDVNILQAYRRASRGSRTKTLFVMFLRYEDSVEDRMYDINRAKNQLARRVDPTRKELIF